MKNKKRGARILSLALSAVMVFTMVPVSALATTMPTLGTGNVCTHKHDENCGYAEATAGVDCTHTGENACGTQIERQEEISCDKACTETNDAGEIKHAEDCAYSPAVEGRDPVACNHTDDCGYVPAVDGSDCVHVCDVACGGIEQPVQPPVCVKIEGCTLLDEHEGECSLNEIEDDCICNSEVGTHTNEACAFYVAHSFTGVKSGTCGGEGNEENVTWALMQNNEDTENPTFTLTIAGTGTMADYIGWNKAPWCTAITGAATDKNSITALIIEEGITEIGAYAFVGHTNIPEIILPNSVVEVHGNAFNNCTAVTTIEWSSNLKTIGASAFQYLTGYTGSLVLPQGLNEIGLGAFGAGNYSGDLNIPGSVIHIGTSAFSNNTGLNGTLTLEEGVKTIGDSAFNGCKFIGNLTIPNSVTAIGESTFSSKFTGALKIGNQVETIGKQAFYGTGFTGELIIPDSVDTIGDSAFDNNGFSVIQVEGSVDSIGNSAFINSTSTHSLDLSSVSENVILGGSAFKSLKNPNIIYLNSAGMTSTIEDVITENRSSFAITNGGVFEKNGIFEEGVLAVPSKDGYIFGGWYDNAGFTGEKVTAAEVGKTYYAKWIDDTEIAKSVNVANGQTLKQAVDGVLGQAKYDDITTLTVATAEGAVLTPEDFHFMRDNLSALASLDILNARCEDNKIPENAFYRPKSEDNSVTELKNGTLETVKFPKTITSIGNLAFYYCSNLKDITLPEGLKTLEKSPFGYCNLMDVKLPSTLLSMGESAFQENAKLKTINFPEGLTSIGVYAFGGCKKLNNITLPKSLEMMDGAFTSCSSLKSIVIPSSVTEIGIATFTGCSELTSVTFEGDITKIGQSAFSECSKLEIEIPSTVKVIGYGAFGNTALKNVVIPDGVVLNHSTFKQCSELTTVTFAGSVDFAEHTNAKGAFADCTKLSVICLPEGVTRIAKATFSGCTALEAVYIPSTVKTIDLVAFQGIKAMAIFYTPSNMDILAGNGVKAITNGGKFLENTTFEPGKLATPTKESYTFAGWYDNANFTGDAVTIATANNTYYAKYTAPSSGGVSGSSYDYYDIKISKEGKGTISPDNRNNKVTVREQTDQTFTFTPDKGYAISDVLVDGKSVGVNATYKFENVTKNHTLKVVFKASEEAEKPQTGVDFEDVRENDWFYEAVQKTVENGWFAGTSDTTFDPDLSTTRGMIATILWRMEGSPKTTGSSSFDDVEVDEWYYDGITWAEKNDIVGGYGDGNYGPNDNITREQLAAILYRYAQFKGYDVSKTRSFDRFIDKDASSEYTYFKSYDKIKNVTLESFTDGGSTSAYAKIAMDWAVVNGLISGRGNNTLAPTASATRAEVATILVRFETLFSKE